MTLELGEPRDRRENKVIVFKAQFCTAAARDTPASSSGAVFIPEYTVTYWSGVPMPAASAWSRIASATQTIRWHRCAARRSAAM